MCVYKRAPGGIDYLDRLAVFKNPNLRVENLSGVSNITAESSSKVYDVLNDMDARFLDKRVVNSDLSKEIKDFLCQLVEICRDNPYAYPVWQYDPESIQSISLNDGTNPGEFGHQYLVITRLSKFKLQTMEDGTRKWVYDENNTPIKVESTFIYDINKLRNLAKQNNQKFFKKPEN